MRVLVAKLVRKGLDCDFRNRSKCGIGLTIGMSAQKSIFVTSILAGSAADGTVENGDQLLRVNGADVNSMSLDAIISHLTGEEGTSVTLELLRKEDNNSSQVDAQSISATSNGCYNAAYSNPPEHGHTSVDQAQESQAQAISNVGSGVDLEEGRLGRSEIEALRLVLHRKNRPAVGFMPPDRSAESAGRVGVGASFALNARGEALVTAVEGPAGAGGAGAGLRPGDLIVAVDGASVQVSNRRAPRRGRTAPSGPGPARIPRPDPARIRLTSLPGSLATRIRIHLHWIDPSDPSRTVRHVSERASEGK